MKFEVEKNSHKKSIVISLSFILLLGILLVIKNSFAKYSSTKTIHIANGYVNYTVDKENPKINSVDITSTSNSITVTINATDDKGIKEYYYQINSNTVIKDTSNTHTFNNLKSETSYTIKIYVTDIKDKTSDTYTNTATTKAITSRDTLAKLKLTSKGKKDTFTGISTSDDTGVYSTSDDFGTSYYFRGDVTNNWVKFAGFYWQIIRINGNGSIRIIYSGKITDYNSEHDATYVVPRYIDTYPYNHTNNDNAYIGYMMGIPLNGTGTSENTTSTNSTSYEEAHANTYDSDIKKKIDSWYSSNLVKVASKIDTNAGFCNDRQVDKTALSEEKGDGYGTQQTGYAPAGRILSGGSTKAGVTPTLKCTNKDRDLFTVSGSSVGNKKLTYPIGLITSDEVIYAGGFLSSENTEYYLYAPKQAFWTMSPFHGATPGTFIVSGSLGLDLGGVSVDRFYGVRPVINLKASAIKGGSGTMSDPYST